MTTTHEDVLYKYLSTHIPKINTKECKIGVFGDLEYLSLDLSNSEIIQITNERITQYFEHLAKVVANELPTLSLWRIAKSYVELAEEPPTKIALDYQTPKKANTDLKKFFYTVDKLANTRLAEPKKDRVILELSSLFEIIDINLNIDEYEEISIFHGNLLKNTWQVWLKVGRQYPSLPAKTVFNILLTYKKTQLSNS